MRKKKEVKLEDRIQEEIRERVMESYQKTLSQENEKDQALATLDALHEITSLPKEEIYKISAEVRQKYEDTREGEEGEEGLVPSSENALERIQVELPSKQEYQGFEQLSEKDEKRKRKFAPHLLAYLGTSFALFVTNVNFGEDYPWALYPIVFWGVGVGAHYMKSVRWPKMDLKRKLKSIKSEIKAILSENWSPFGEKSNLQISRKLRPYRNGVYRLLAAGASENELTSYLQSVELSVGGIPSSEEHLQQISKQLVSLRPRFNPKG